MQSRIIVNGAQGKMGTLACETITNHPDFELVARLGREDNLQDMIGKTRADIVVDLTQANCAYENTMTIIRNGARPVIGTSGLFDDQIKVLKQQCEEKEVGGIIAPNFSIGAILMMRFAAQAARFLPEVEIIEGHHQQKIDAPSGTALKTAEMIASARQHLPKVSTTKVLLEGARGAIHQDVNIHSLRLPGFLASQAVIFGSPGETLTLAHNSIDRSCFMPGLILACQKVLQVHTLYYGLEHFLGD